MQNWVCVGKKMTLNLCCTLKQDIKTACDKPKYGKSK